MRGKAGLVQAEQVPPRRILVLDVLESFARERDIDVHLDRQADSNEWSCLLREGRRAHRGTGYTARAAIREALQAAGVALFEVDAT